MAAEQPHNLPAHLPRLLGREPDIAAIEALLLQQHAELVTLTGAGGCGKTTLALRVAADVREAFPGGVWFVELASLSDESLVLPTVAKALDIQEPPETSLFDLLVAFLAPRTALLVLDNCEHLIATCADLAARLLAACPDLAILTTSREPLQLPGERLYRIPPLPLPDVTQPVRRDEVIQVPSVQLFVERAQAVDATFRLTPENATGIAMICVRLDGIPLAIELAAAQTRILAVDQLRARLDDGFQLLSRTQRGVPDRQRTMRAALDWSYDLLSPAERTVFNRLSVFAGGCELDAVEAVARGGQPRSVCPRVVEPGMIADLLIQLVDKSLVTADTHGSIARYRLLEPVRQYGAEQLATAGETDAIRTVHATYFLSLAEAASPALAGPAQVEWLARLEREHDNLRTALQWLAQADALEPLMRLTIALFPFWEAHDHLREGRRWLELVLAKGDGEALTSPALRAQAFNAAGRLAHQQRDFAAAEAFHRQSLRLFQALGDPLGIATELCELGMETRMQDRLACSARLLEQSLAQCRELGDRSAIAYALLNSGITASVSGEFVRARELLGESLARYREQGNLRFIAIAQAMLGETCWLEHDLAAAGRHFADALAGHARVGNRWFVVYDLKAIAAVLVARGDAGGAARLLGAARGRADALGEVLSPIGASRWGHVAGEARACLGEERFTQAWEDGRRLPREAAIADALASVMASGNREKRPEASVVTASVPLTRREREVAELLARGQNNRQIADALYITPGTVGVHVHNILGKLGVRSRWQVGAALPAASQGSAEPSGEPSARRDHDSL